MRIKLFLSYDGTDFCGWQRQKNGVSVQETLEDAIFTLTNEKVIVTGSGRTDAGVHAKMQVAHFDTKSSIPPEKFYKAINTLLPPTIAVYKSKKVSDNFHAVKTAKSKTYTYSFYVSETTNPLLDRYSLKVPSMPDFNLIQDAINLLVGEHDFKCFCASNSTAKTTVRTIYDINLKKSKNAFSFSVTGNGFLYNMVRSLSGTLLEIGYNRLLVDNLEKALKTGERNLIGKTLKANGLCLMKVNYK